MKRAVKTNEMIVADKSFNIADYPSCEFFLPITETSGLVLNDLAGNQDITFAQLVDETFAFAGNGVTIAGTVGMTSDGAETLPDLGTTKDFVYLVVADFNADNTTPCSIGGKTVNDPVITIRRKSGTGTSVIRDTTPTTTTFIDTTIDANTEAAAMSTDRAAPNEASLIETDGAAIADSAASPITLTATAGMDLDENSSTIVLGTSTKLYGAAVFTFDAIPSDLLAAISWMNYQWRQGNKVIYPAWKNKT